MSTESETGTEGQSVAWWTPPGETDITAFAALILLFLLIFGIVHAYARFDRYAEKHNEGTPLKTTVPTLLLIAFAYEIFPPLSHFSILLPLALIATALARDLMLWFEPMKEHTLKGEIDDVLLDEMQRENLGEHDHLGKRVQEKPSEKPSLGSRATQLVQAAKSKLFKSAEKPPQEAPGRGGTKG